MTYITAWLLLQHKVEILADGVAELVLDTKGIKIARAAAAGKEAELSWGPEHKVGGGRGACGGWVASGGQDGA